MAAAAAPTRWQTATVIRVTRETGRAKTFRLRIDQATPHLAGQHYVVRLTAPDGYTAARSYSVASAPDESSEIDLTVERLDGGEVSTFLHDVVEPGDELEVRGPIGGWFVWDGTTPALLVGGGSGVVPLMAMLRLARRIRGDRSVRLVVSVRSPDDLYYAAELPGADATVVYTRRNPPGV
ncbi:MAG: FAD-binding oxidoreductase, partial [Actinomycetota bacterium]|nr:FAD-binding oxidoreductase [Actinomycetota bacterium]